MISTILSAQVAIIAYAMWIVIDEIVVEWVKSITYPARKKRAIAEYRKTGGL